MQGLHLTVDLFECRDPAGLMRDGAALAGVCEALARDAGLSVVGRQFHAFSPHESSRGTGVAGASGVTGVAGGAGVTGVLLLAESHLAVHTWPELQAVTLDVFVCNFGADNSHKAHQLVDALVPRFEPGHVQRQQLSRGRPS
jgi:S-adenosylmethionine/arginine decarboxylase-like enzyme